MRLSKGTLSKALTGVLLLTLLAAACAPMGGDINGRTVTARTWLSLALATSEGLTSRCMACIPRGAVRLRLALRPSLSATSPTRQEDPCTTVSAPSGTLWRN